MHDVSIIIPHYNSPLLLEKLLATIPDRENIQTIVIDDNSTKDTEWYEQVRKSYGDRVEFYRNDTGIQSAGACRNIGLEYADGKWVMFADADDYFLPDMYGVISRYFHSDYELVIFCSTSVFLDTGMEADRHLLHRQRIEKYIAEPTHKNLMKVERIREPVAKIIKRQVIEENYVRFSTTQNCNDMYFVTMIYRLCKRTAVSDEIVYCITRNKGSLTTIVTQKTFDNHVQEYMKCYQFCRKNYGRADMRILNYNGASLLYEAFVRRLGMGVIVKTTIKFVANGMPIITWTMLNPVTLYRLIKERNNIVKRDKKYWC